ncbi:unnamed protein product [Owenia fusiformis]|uniref:Uncharacterized protein n=1 Tax=Owenia fusiformis TaxID=6347 RepID=A0A8S4PX15_OWEFU|nr:unnamed protein product [Owenia fusiformis]
MVSVPGFHSLVAFAQHTHVQTFKPTLILHHCIQVEVVLQSNMPSTILALILVVAFAAYGHCLKCFNCNSKMDANCTDDNFGLRPKIGTCQGRIGGTRFSFSAAELAKMNEQVVNDTCCEGDNIKCMTITSTLNGEKVYNRGCTMASISGCISGNKTSACFCASDHCNGIAQQDVTTRKVTTPENGTKINGCRPHFLFLLIITLAVLLN